MGPVHKIRFCRRYESIKGQRQAELQALEEEQRLIDLLRADDVEQASMLEAQRRREKSQQLRREMTEANQLQIQLKVQTRPSLLHLSYIQSRVMHNDSPESFFT